MKTTTFGNPDSKNVLIQMVDDYDLKDMKSEITEIKKRTDEDFCLIAIKVRNWNADLSPWEAPAVFGREGFGSGAADTLAEILKHCTDRDRRYIIGGYSLSGLFALWTAYQTDTFKGVAAASPSVWFPGFVEYMEKNSIHADTVFLSLGDKEEKVKNPVVATVAERIRRAYALLGEQKVNVTLEWNPGNHFKDAGIRMAKAFAWVMVR